MPADSHCHLNDPAFDEDLEEVISRIKEEGMDYLLNVGYDLQTSRKAVELAERYDTMYASVGVHPHNASQLNDNALAELGKLADHPRVVAIGETGLDYYRDRSPREDQVMALRAHMELAKKLKKPLIIHCRDAMEDCLKILEDEDLKKTGGVMHCFAGAPDDARRCLKLGMYISFAGNVTYPKAGALRESLKAVPGHRLLLETDSPYLAPQKKRGRRNSPAFLKYVVDKAAEVRGVTREDIERITVTNFKTLFKTGGVEKGEVAYKIRNSLYLNVTKECTNECYFCARFHSDTVQGHNLRISSDPTAEEMIEAMGDPSRYDEIVFCGFGEPALRLDAIMQVARVVKEKGGRTRLNTNGHANQIAGKDVTPQLAGLIDIVSVSLNTADAATYNEICSPLIPDAYQAVIDFIKSAKASGLSVTATAVDIPGKVNAEDVRRLAEDELGVGFRLRSYNLVG
ncbi:MAG TPA: YchF/TatD family DNA exonuclease [Nitrospirae bacterium]|nr:YchF/TatD family DNA exonuclease [Nitrospirota bacterium]